MHPTAIELVAAVIFALTLIHTFSAGFFERLAHANPANAGIWHLLGEVEIVFGLWAMVLVVFMAAIENHAVAIRYLETRNFTEPMFVFVIMVVAAGKPILHCVACCVRSAARALPLPTHTAFYLVALSLLPLFGSVITEPAAMTLAALLLRDRIFARDVSTRLKYATLAVLFVNVSIGGVLTPYAAPPVLMVAHAWGWDLRFMLTHFGWQAALAVVINALTATLLFRKELNALAADYANVNAGIARADAAANAGARMSDASQMPAWVIAMHLSFLVAIVLAAHHAVIFIALFLAFMGYVTAYPQYQNRLILREGLLVALFLAGLVVLGGEQQWWLQPLLTSMNNATNNAAVYFGATALTAITDNAALTYLGSLVQGLSENVKIALVAGAITGGGLTVIANAPNPAGLAILRRHFANETVNPLRLFTAALWPTLVAIFAFRCLG